MAAIFRGILPPRANLDLKFCKQSVALAGFAARDPSAVRLTRDELRPYDPSNGLSFRNWNSQPNDRAEHMNT